MKWKVVLMLVGWCFTTSVMAQEDTIPDRKTSIKVSPFNLINPWDGTLLAGGVEFKVKGNIASYTELGLYLPEVNINPALENNRGFLIKQEVKRYMNAQGQTTGPYWSVELSYSQQRYSRTDTINIPGYPAIDKYSKKYDLERSFYGVAGQLGNSFSMGRFFAEGYAGLVVRFNTVKCNGLTNREAKYREMGDWNNPNNWIHRCGFTVFPKVLLGFKIGYTLLQ